MSMGVSIKVLVGRSMGCTPTGTSSYSQAGLAEKGMVTMVGVGRNGGSCSWIGMVLLDIVVGVSYGREGVGGEGELGKGVVSVSPSIFCGGFYRYLHSWA